MGVNITREEAAARAAVITVDSYTIEVDVRGVCTDMTFGSTTTVRFASVRPGATTWIDLVADEVLSAELNGVAIPVGDYDGARLNLPDLAAGNELVVSARCRYMTTGEGLHRLVDPADGEHYLYTQFAMADARRVFACFEQPDLKAHFSWRVVAPARWEVRSNTAPLTQPQDLGGDLACWSFPPTPKLPTYLAALCAGPFHVMESEYAGEAGTYPLALLVRGSMAQFLDADEVFDLTRAGLAHYEEIFDIPYPFGKYDQVALPEFNLGAMENPGLVTFMEDLLVFRSQQTDSARERRAMIVLHEMAHMWFGNLVTMRWWDDLWLNESFAEWAGFSTSAAATRFTQAWASFAQSRKAWAYQQDQQPSTHPVAADIRDLQDVYLNIDGITYAKGASIIKQLVAFVGLEAFLAGLNRYFAAHAWGNATLADLLSELEGASGRDLHGWARAWLQEPGVTTLQPRVEVDAQGRYTRVLIEQLPANRPEGVTDLRRPHRIAVGVYRWSGADQRHLVRDLRLEVEVPGAAVEVPELVGVAAADLLLVNDDDLTYAKVRFDEGSLNTALDSVGALTDPLPRTLVWCALWEMVRDGLLPAQEFVTVALEGMRGEDRPLTIEMVLGQAHAAVSKYVAEELRDAVAARMCAGTADLLDGADPGSDRQLALARAHVASAVDPGRLARLSELVADRGSLPGLPVDADLRWAIVIRLAERGVADEAFIDEVLADDRTSSGERAAAQARAARPTSAAKAQAWAGAVDSDGLPNAILGATVAGFSTPETPPEVLEPYRAQYFAVVPALWQDRPPAAARTLARGLFPGVDPLTVTAADHLLAQSDLPDGLRRIVAESRAEAVLALACQEVSRASH